MYKFILIALTTFITLNVQADEYFYFGDEQTMKNKFAEKMLSFFKKPSLFCKRAYLQSHPVLNASSRYASATSWVSTRPGSLVLIRDYLEVPSILDTNGFRNPKHSSLRILTERYGTDPRRRVIMAMGNIETSTDKEVISPIIGITDFTSILKTSREFCLVIAPHPYIKEKFKATRTKYIEELRAMQKDKNGRCDVILYDENKYGELQLKEDGLNLTDESYENWADATIESICKDTQLLIR